MKPSQTTLLIGGLLVIGLTAGAVGWYQKNQLLEEPGITWRPIPDSSKVEILLPDQLPGYVSESLPVTQEELEMLPPDTSFGRRRYVAADGLAVDLSVVVMGGDRSSLHRPQACLPAQGWMIRTQEVTSVRIAQPHPYDLTFNKLSNDKEWVQDGRTNRYESLYLYWFVSRNRLAVQRRDWVMSTAKTMITTGRVERWAYVTIAASCPAGFTGVIYPRLVQFLQVAVPEFQVPAGPTPDSPS